MIGSSYSIVQILTFSILGLILFFVSLFTGLFLYNSKLNNKIKTYFLNSFLGLFTVVSLYSFAIVGIKTINLLSFSILIYLFIKNKERFKFDKLDFKELVPVLYIFPIVFILCGCYTLPLTIESDVRYYSKLTYSLVEFRQENFYHFYNQYSNLFHGVAPYHYFEMWVASLFAVPFSIKSIVAIKYVAYPFLISGISYGVLGFTQNNKFLFFLLFICLSTFPFYLISVLGSGFSVYTDFWMRPNFITYYYILLPVFYFIIEKEWVKLYLIVLIGCTTSIIVIPCLFGGIFLLSLFLIFQKAITKKDAVLLNALLLIMCILIFVFLKLFSPTVNLVVNHPFKEILLQSLGIWKAVVHTIATLFIECSSLVLMAFMLNKYLIKNDRLKNIFFFVIVQVIIGIVLFQVLNKLDNAYQFPYFAYASTGFILIIVLLMTTDSFKINSVRLSASALIIVFCLYFSYSSFGFNTLSTSLENKNLLQNNVSENWIRQVSSYFNENRNAKGGFVLCETDLKSIDPKSRSCIVVQTGSFISYISDKCNLPDLTCRDTLLSDKNNSNKETFEKLELWMKVFPIFINKCNVNDYIKDGTIDYFICSNNVRNIDTSLVKVVSDEKSKFVFACKKK